MKSLNPLLNTMVLKLFCYYVFLQATLSTMSTAMMLKPSFSDYLSTHSLSTMSTAMMLKPLILT